MDEAGASARVRTVLTALREWAMSSQKNLDFYTDTFHEADEGKRHEAVLEIVVRRLGMTPEDAAIVMALMKEERQRGEEFLEKILGPAAPPSSGADDDCPF